MELVVALLLVAVAAVAMLIFVGYERGPTPSDVAVAYQIAAECHDYSTLFDLSTPELRGTKLRKVFVSTQRAQRSGVIAGHDISHGAVRVVAVELTDSSAVVTLRRDTDRPESRTCVLCSRRNGRWLVARIDSDLSDK